MDIRVIRFVRSDTDGALKAFCDVSLGNRVLIKGIRIVEGRTGPFISMPRQQSKTGKWYDSIVPLCPDLRARLHQTVLDAYRNLDASPTTDPEATP